MWDFGNGKKSNSPNPQILFNNVGTYNIKLIVVYAKTTREINKTITLNAKTPITLTANQYIYCSPSAVNFTASTDSVFGNYTWSYGDNSTPQLTNSNTTSHLFNQFGEFNVTVNFTNANGCKTSDNKLIKIIEPIIQGNYDNGTGCIPVNNSFNTSVNLASGNITNFQWDFGDGTIQNSISNLANHIYQNEGNYLPRLTITTNEGCTKTFDFDSVHYGFPPTNLIAYSIEDTFCASEKVKFYAFANNANSYDWDFGNGNIFTAYDTITAYKFSSLGNKVVKVTPRFNNCAGETRIFNVFVKGTIAKFNFHNSCLDKRTFQFNNTSAGSNLVFDWNWGSPNRTNSLSTDVTFPDNGIFNIQLISTDTSTGCADTANSKVYIASPFLVNDINRICINSNTTFTIINGYNNPSATYSWNVFGNPLRINRDTTYSITATELGNFQNSVIINNGNSYCKDTLLLDHLIAVTGPNINFLADSSLCLESALTVRNLSFPFNGAESITNYQWQFGDWGTYNGFQPLNYTYQKEGTYKIQLTGTDINGCRDSITKVINVRPMPFLWIIPRDATKCQGWTSNIIAYTSDSITWRTSINTINFCNNCDTNIIQPLHHTTYYASAINNFSCKSFDTVSIKVLEPFNAITTINDTSVCEKSNIQLGVYPRDKEISWIPNHHLDFSNGKFTPITTALNSIQYIARLTDTLGCFSSDANINIHVNPNPAVNIENKMVPYNTTFNLNPSYGNHIINYQWSPATDLSCSNCAFPSTSIKQTKTYTIKVTSDSGCVSSDDVTLFVECNNAYITMPTAFTPNNDGLNDYFYPLAYGIKKIKHFAIYNRNSQLIFEQYNFTPNNRSNGWNGKFSGQDMPPGTYVYVIEAECEFGYTTIKKGSVVLIK